MPDVVPAQRDRADEISELREQLAVVAADLRALRRITAPATVIGFAGLLIGGITGIGWMAISPIQQDISTLAANGLPKEYILEKFNQAEKDRLAIQLRVDSKADKSDMNRVIADLNRTTDVVNGIDHKLRDLEVRLRK